MGQYLQYGGQAVIEGVMMRSPRFFAVACRKPDGTIIVQDEPVDKSIIGRLKWLNRPFLRGTLALIDAMALGMRALTFSASVQAQAISEEERRRRGEEERGREGEGENIESRVESRESRVDPERLTPDAQRLTPSARRHNTINDIAIGVTMVVSICIGIALFVALPTFLTQVTQRHLGFPIGQVLPYRQQVVLNVVDGIVRLTIFLSYIALISRMENIRRVFEYHGAEHKAINTLEGGEALTVENCLRASRIHPRCGTSFIIVVLMAGILLHCAFPRPDNYFVRLALHIGLIPFVAGLAYEVIKMAGRFRDSWLPRTLLAPGLWTQRLTTREPDADQIQVAIAALQTVLDRERDVETANIPAPAAVAY
jgi:uncharacterized protein YqhQ